jgi:hypothetical protein
MEDIQTKLSELLGREVKQVRRTDEVPPRISIIDVAIAVMGKTQHDAAQDFRRLSDQYPEVGPNCSLYKFKGRRQRDTPVTSVKGIVEIIMLFSGRQAARVRRLAAELLCRWLGGDLAIIDEVCALRGFQEELAVRAPEDPRRLFGEAVEASSPLSGRQWASVLSNMSERLANQEQTLAKQGQLLARIRESVESDRQRVNLNVRAPKRAGAFNPRITMDLSEVERPFPVAKFLDLKEREDPSWKCARRSFAPTFGMQVQVLKKQKLKEQGRPAVFVEQNHRAQLLYTEEDMPLMEEAWELTAAHREDLVGTHGNPQDAPVEIDRPRRKTVMDLLQNSRG